MANVIGERIARYRAWLNRKPVSRPMLGLLWEPDIPPLPEMMDEVGMGSLGPEQIRPEMFLPYVEGWFEYQSGLQGDVIQPFTPAFGIPWVEAVVGCPVSARPGSLWAEPCLAAVALLGMLKALAAHRVQVPGLIAANDELPTGAVACAALGQRNLATVVGGLVRLALDCEAQGQLGVSRLGLLSVSRLELVFALVRGLLPLLDGTPNLRVPLGFRSQCSSPW